MLVIFSGLPGTGKSTIACRLARETQAVYLRIDSLEMGIVRSGLVDGQRDIGPAGYEAGYAVALDNLRNGMAVVADSVNPLWITRDAWRDVAVQAGRPSLDVEVVCSDQAEHRRRVEERSPEIDGLRLPSWQEVIGREYDPWVTERLILDTATLSPPHAVALIMERLRQDGNQHIGQR